MVYKGTFYIVACYDDNDIIYSLTIGIDKQHEVRITYVKAWRER